MTLATHPVGSVGQDRLKRRPQRSEPRRGRLACRGQRPPVNRVGGRPGEPHPWAPPIPA
jgi:hypothetical protein